MSLRKVLPSIIYLRLASHSTHVTFKFLGLLSFLLIIFNCTLPELLYRQSKCLPVLNVNKMDCLRVCMSVMF